MTEGPNATAKREALADPIRIATELAASEWIAERLKAWPDPWDEANAIPPTVDGPDGPRVHPAWTASGAEAHLWQAANAHKLGAADPEGVRKQAARWAIDKLADLPETPDSETGLSMLAAYWRRRPRDPTRRHVHAIRERHPPKDSESMILTRQPGVLTLAAHAALEAVEVDGMAFATRTIGGVETKLRRYTLAESQGDLFPGPRKLAGEATAGAIFEAVAWLVLSGDERSPLRADLLRLANLAFALPGPTEWTEADGAALIGGADTPANRTRFHNALWALRGLSVLWRPDRRWPMAAADPDPKRNVIGPPRWWVAYMGATKGTRRGSRERRKRLAAAGLDGGPVAWRYTGCLFVPASKWGAVERTVSGIESALLWGSSPGRGKRGNVPDNLQPVRKGGPGPKVFVPWWQVLRLSGENIGPDTPSRGAPGQRYRDRRARLERAGYFADRTGTAPAGGTVEVIERVRGSRARQAGLWVRASARFCTAYALHERVLVPASRLIEAP